MCCSLLHKDLLEFIPECAVFPRQGPGWIGEAKAPRLYFLSLGLLPSFQLLYFFLWLGIQQFSSSSQAY